MEIVYGINPISEVIRARRRKIIKLRTSDPKRLLLLEKKSGIKGLKAVIESRYALKMHCGSEHHQGVVADVEDYPYVKFDEILEKPQKFIVSLDDLTDPQNVGSILRSAYCAGVSGATLRSHHSSKITSSVAKSSAGAVEHLLVSLVPNHSEVIKRAKAEGFIVAALDMEGTSIYKEKLPLKRPILLIIGSEDQGVHSILKRQCDYLFKIPMKGTLNSLNASAAAAVALFEIARRRS
ncbi:MAG: 23S rRNA (guanosine(2251)-2'-O)-methyltransferase RlmB [Acidobacteria bacterium]|nr:23S rRNA (guanosine(2251)-2'-O)-methyltransferase RlmB [Acidobacteriota bacterium]